MLNRTVIGLTLVVLLAASASAQDRARLSEKGSLLIFPKVELRFAGPNPFEAEILTDTFISVTNDIGQPVSVQLYFVNENCTHFDAALNLTREHTAYFSAATGEPGPFNQGALTPFWHTGLEEDPENPGTYVARGYLVAFAVNGEWKPINHNYLQGEATIVDYVWGSAWEYNAYAFRVNSVADGAVVPGGDAGELRMNGTDYDSGFNYLVFPFYAFGSTAFSTSRVPVIHDTDLTLLIQNIDVTLDHPDVDVDGDGDNDPWPWHTLVYFDRVWNSNESPISYEQYCIKKWDSRMISNISGVFGPNLQTDKGYARIYGVGHSSCDVYDIGHDLDMLELVESSIDTPLLGTATRVMAMLYPNGDDQPDIDVAYAGGALRGAGTQSATLWYDIPSGGESKPVKRDASVGQVQRTSVKSLVR